MKAAAAVLGASLLFFVGVLTGAGRREAVAPPAAIPLGATNQPAAGSGATSPSSPAAPDTTNTTAPAAGTAPSGAPPGTASTATSVPATASSTTTTKSGQVQPVDNQVDCTSSTNRGKGKREPCPSSSTSSTREAPGGGRNG